MFNYRWQRDNPSTRNLWWPNLKLGGLRYFCKDVGDIGIKILLQRSHSVVWSWVSGLNPQTVSFWKRSQHWSLLWTYATFFKKKKKLKLKIKKNSSAVWECSVVLFRGVLQEVGKESLQDLSELFKPVLFNYGFGDHRKPAMLHEIAVNVFLKALHVHSCTSKSAKKWQMGEKKNLRGRNFAFTWFYMKGYLDLGSQKGYASSLYALNYRINRQPWCEKSSPLGHLLFLASAYNKMFCFRSNGTFHFQAK